MHTTDINKKQEEVEHYYDEYVQRQLKAGVNKRHHSILDKLKKSGLKSTDRILEIGCGIGTFTGLLIKEVSKGHVTAMDISGASIRYAKENNSVPNLQFIHADAVNHDFGDNLFDVIVLPDVLEHIPIELHSELFAKLSQILKKEGLIFIHIPNPYYLQWCHENRPELLQIIDQPITTDIMVKNTYPNGLFIEELKSYPIWIVHHDYQYIVLRKNRDQDFSKIIENRPTFFDKLKYKLNALRK